MKAKVYVSLVLSLVCLGSASFAEVVLRVGLGKKVQLPYCEGQTQLVCSSEEGALDNGNCKIEFTGTRCSLAHIYTASNFYPTFWTLQNQPVSGHATSFSVDPDRVNGVAAPYFFVFLHSPGFQSYIKIRYEFSP